MSYRSLAPISHGATGRIELYTPKQTTHKSCASPGVKKQRYGDTHFLNCEVFLLLFMTLTHTAFFHQHTNKRLPEDNKADDAIQELFYMHSCSM